MAGERHRPGRRCRHHPSLERNGNTRRWRKGEAAQGLPSTLDKRRQLETREAHAMNAQHVAGQHDVPIVSHPHDWALRRSGFEAAGPQLQQGQ